MKHTALPRRLLSVVVVLAAGGLYLPALSQDALLLQTPTPWPTWPNPQPSLQAGSVPQAILPLDFNQDGFDDLVVASAYSDSISLLANVNGAGTFRNVLDMNVGPAPGLRNDLPRDVVTADFNNDGLTDLAVINSGGAPPTTVFADSSLAILLGQPSGFASPRYPPLAPLGNFAALWCWSLATADVDRNGDTDLVIANLGEGTFSVMRGRGDGWFDLPVTFSAAASGNGPIALVATDLNQDGNTDVILASARAVTVTSILSPLAAPTPAVLFAENSSNFQDLVVSDFDHNGSLDVAVVDANSPFVRIGMDLAPNGTMSRSITASLGIDLSFGRPSAIACEDLDQDGHPDLVVSVMRSRVGVPAGSDQVIVLRGTGDGTFQRINNAPLPAHEPRDVALLLADPLGALDIVTANQADEVDASNADVSLILNPVQQRPPTRVTLVEQGTMPPLDFNVPGYGFGPMEANAMRRGRVSGVATGEAGSILVSADDPSGVVFRIGPSGQVHEVVRLGVALSAVAYDTGNHILYALDGLGGRVFKLNTTGPEPVSSFVIPEISRVGGTGMVFHPGRRSLFVAGTRQLLEIDPLTGARRGNGMALDGSIDPAALAVVPDTGALLLISDRARRVLCLDVTGKVNEWTSVRDVVPRGVRLTGAVYRDTRGTVRLYGYSLSSGNEYVEVDLDFTREGDLDQDGISDNFEGWPALPGQTHRLLDDSDGDGLRDGQEDANRNGRRDSGETMALWRDSDNDRTQDAIEVLFLRSDPLNAQSPGPLLDRDSDGLPDMIDTQPLVADADSDLFADGYEAAYFGLLSAAQSAAVRPPMADPDLNGAITNLDALIVQSLFLLAIEPTNPVFRNEGFRHTDPYADGQITNLDALVVQSVFLQIVRRLPIYPNEMPAADPGLGNP